MNDVRAEQPALRVLPAHQRLVALHLERAQVDDRLEVHDHLAGLDRRLHVGHQLHAIDGGGAHRVLEELDAGLAVGLGRVHGQVGVPQHALARLVAPLARPRLALTRRSRPATENGTASADSTRCAITGPSVPALVALDQDGELVATDAGDRVTDAHAGPQPLAHRHEQAVAGVVAEAVVHGLEVVEVDEEHRHRSRRAAARARGRGGRGTAPGWRAA